MSGASGCKVDSTIEQYNLGDGTGRYDDIDEVLLARWNGTDGQRSEGYRSLTEWFNKRVLKRVYDESGRETVGMRLDSEYDALTDDDDLLREEVADDLRADGIDVDSVRSDMVSWSTMRHHLNDCLGGEKTVESNGEWERESVRIARNQLESKVGDAAQSLASKEEIAGGDAAEVTVQVYLSCPECPTRVPFGEARQQGYVCADHLGAEAVEGDRA